MCKARWAEQYCIGRSLSTKRMGGGIGQTKIGLGLNDASDQSFPIQIMDQDLSDQIPRDDLG